MTTTTDTPRPPWTARWLRRLGVTLCFAGGFAGMVMLLHEVLPESHRPLTRRKLDLLVEAQADTVFVGSSRVLRHLDPDRFDAALAARGQSVRSFNLSAPQMSTLEAEFVIGELFERRPEGIRTIILDPEYIEPVLPDQKAETERMVLWHTFDHTVRTTQRLLKLHLPLWDLQQALREHWKAFGRRLISFGELQMMFVGEDSAVAQPFRDQELGAEGRGFMNFEDAYRSAQGDYRRELEMRRKMFVRKARRWRGMVRRHAGSISARTPPPPLERQSILRIQARARQHDAHVVFLILPGVLYDNRNYLRAMRRKGEIDHLIDLGHPAKHPELYDLAITFDENHLKAKGAELITDKVAEAIAGWMEQGEL